MFSRSIFLVKNVQKFQPATKINTTSICTGVLFCQNYAQAEPDFSKSKAADLSPEFKKKVITPEEMSRLKGIVGDKQIETSELSALLKQAGIDGSKVIKVDATLKGSNAYEIEKNNGEDVRKALEALGHNMDPDSETVQKYKEESSAFKDAAKAALKDPTHGVHSPVEHWRYSFSFPNEASHELHDKVANFIDAKQLALASDEFFNAPAENRTRHTYCLFYTYHAHHDQFEELESLLVKQIEQGIEPTAEEFKYALGTITDLPIVLKLLDIMEKHNVPHNTTTSKELLGILTSLGETENAMKIVEKTVSGPANAAGLKAYSDAIISALRAFK